MDSECEYAVEGFQRLLSDFSASESGRAYLTPCIYCGMPCDSTDHIPPRHLRDQLVGLDLVALGEKEVPACRECNSALGRRPLITVLERRGYVKNFLRRKYASYLRIPNWTEEELETFGHDLQGMIRRNLALRDEVRKRLAWGATYGRATSRSSMPELPETLHHEVQASAILLSAVPVEALGEDAPKDKPHQHAAEGECEEEPSWKFKIRKGNGFTQKCNVNCLKGGAMKERPILMTPENAQKVHEGIKTQTRRTNGLDEVNSCKHWDYPQMTRPGVATFLDSSQANPYNNALDVKCPYGQVGDRLWIRHATWKPHRIGDIRNDQRWNPVSREIIWGVGAVVANVAGVSEESWRKIPSLHMPRWACRTVVELTDVRVERLNDISEADAKAEGCEPHAPSGRDGKVYRRPFECLWESIRGKGSWAINPWVWVLSFRKVEP